MKTDKLKDIDWKRGTPKMVGLYLIHSGESIALKRVSRNNRTNMLELFHNEFVSITDDLFDDFLWFGPIKE